MELKRETYLQKIRPYYDVDLIKVITGVRRAGKSVLLQSIQQELVARGVPADHVIYRNFEQLEYGYIQTAMELHQDLLAQMRDDQKYYIFLDEIQQIPDFEKVLASLRARRGLSLFVTGSNSTLLSGELATRLTGRTVEFEVLPFSFREMQAYIALNGKAFSDDLIYDYLKWGGFPVRFDFSREEDIRRYLENLYHGLLERDILSHTRAREKKVFMDVSLYILANAGKEFSASNVAAYYSQHSGNAVSTRTVYTYLQKMQQAFLIHRVKRYNLVGKTALKSRDKFYAVDMGFRTINTNSINFEDTYFLENVVYNELLAQGFTVYTGKTYKAEVDFVAIRDGRKCFIQVCYLLASASTVAREFGAFARITDASPKYVLSLDRVDFSRNGIAHVNLVDFLLGRRELALT